MRGDWSGSAWVQHGSDIDGEAPHDESGFSVAMSGDGDAVIVGAIYNAGGGGAGEEAGHARVWDWDLGTNSLIHEYRNAA